MGVAKSQTPEHASKHRLPQTLTGIRKDPHKCWAWLREGEGGRHGWRRNRSQVTCDIFIQSEEFELT